MIEPINFDCELCGETYHIDERFKKEKWCVYCEDESPSEEELSQGEGV